MLRFHITAAATAILLASASHADTITVCASGCEYTSINTAILVANEGDILKLHDETYMEGIVIDTLGKAITIRGATDKSGAPASILDGDNSHLVLACQNSETNATVFENLAIQNGHAIYGGGMNNSNSSPTVTNCTFTGNSAVNSGGGMYNDNNSSPTLTNCTFTDSSAHSGGGMYNIFGSSPTLTNCAFMNNSAENGGGMCNLDSSPTLTNCTFTANSANYGGGMCNSNSNPILDNCTFTGNSAIFGGGMYNDSSSPTGTGLAMCGNMPQNISGDPYSGSNICQSSLIDCSDCTDSDNDGIPDFMDICDGGDDTTDSDADGTPDACDNCPNDPLKIEPAQCGCGVVDTNIAGDLDCDGDFDEEDARAAMEVFGIEEASDCEGDINGDGDVDGADLSLLLGAWGVCP